MPDPPRRFKFQILHGIILVAGVASCFSMRWTMLVFWGELQKVLREWQANHSIFLALSHGLTLFSESTPLMAVATVTLLALTLGSSRRPRLRALTRRPDFVALFTAVVVLALFVGLDVVDRSAGDWLFPYSRFAGNPQLRRPFDLEYLLNKASGLPGYAIAAAWILLALGGRWRPASNRLDFASRLMGVYWIALSVFRMLYPYSF